MGKRDDGERTGSFQRNRDLEALLTELNSDLWPAEKALLETPTTAPEQPLIFIVGPLRSGSTLFMQWLASLGLFAYPSNLLSRFYHAPILGAKIQLLLTDERYNFRNEILDFNAEVDFTSFNGKTTGALAPNEFWYFWRRFLPFDEIDYLPNEELKARADGKTLAAELAGVARVLGRPLAMKAMILSHNIDYLAGLFDNAIFVHTCREPLANIASGLDARRRQYGDIDTWYSFKIPEYEQLKSLSPHEQVAGQVFHINRAVEEGLSHLSDERKLVVEYEAFCRSPEYYYRQLRDRLASLGCAIPEAYNGPVEFDTTRKQVDDPLIAQAWSRFQ